MGPPLTRKPLTVITDVIAELETSPFSVQRDRDYTSLVRRNLPIKTINDDFLDACF